MSSLGFQTICRELASHPGLRCERAFLPDDRANRGSLTTYESLAPVGSFDLIAFSVAYELELAGLIECLDLAGLPPLSSERSARHPIVIAGGPLTFSNPLPLGPYVDAVLLGEGEQIVHLAIDAIGSAGSKLEALDRLDAIGPCWIPSRHGERLPALARADDSHLPARSVILTPHTELASMFLVEAERGCPRGCTYCVMRRGNRGSMRLLSPDVILSSVPEHARKVGLVGAAVSDHPHVVEIVSRLAEQGRNVALSSLRPDRLDDDLVSALKRAGARSLTTAADGASERLRLILKRGGKTQHLLRAAELVRKHALSALKLYVMIGVPGETTDDIEELARLGAELSRICPLSFGIAPFVSKRATPLDRQPFAGIRVIEERLMRLRARLKGRATIRPTSARWAWVEYVLAQGGIAQGRAVLDALRNGGSFAAYRTAFEGLEPCPTNLSEGASSRDAPTC